MGTQGRRRLPGASRGAPVSLTAVELRGALIAWLEKNHRPLLNE